MIFDRVKRGHTMSTQHETDLAFIITSKGFDTSSPESLQKVLTRLRTTDGDNLMYGEPTGDEFDKMVGEMRRPMLIESVERAIITSAIKYR